MKMIGTGPAGMKPTAMNRAADALKAVLFQTSQVKLKNIEMESPRPDLKVDILAQVDVHGHSHTLVCMVEASGRPDHVRMALQEMQDDAARIDGNTTMVFIAPHISEEAQALCTEKQAGFVDLEGNGRLYLGDVFIGKRSLPMAARRSSAPVIGCSAQQLAGVA